ncbi:hypothetical protein A5N15_07920 [Rothia kristinae]|uniref:Uncharacterized protein n=1 Tax=Rothia kristinae TaxID=37923 RepID=A0A657IUD8_9MICC|nr:hypothetical protein A5N15_07920 [Rothia kristinae]
MAAAGASAATRHPLAQRRHLRELVLRRHGLADPGRAPPGCAEPEGRWRGQRPGPRRRPTLYPQLRRAITAETGGGAFWSKKLDFKNTPATAPIALALAHAGQAQTSQRLLDWLRERLFAEGQGYWDGIKLVAQQDGTVEHRVERNLYSYNQGTVLGALLETPGADLEHAEELIGLIAEKMTTSLEVEGTPVRILNTRGSGDAGLFAGILARYLTQAARDTRLASTARATARDLVLATAELLWAGRGSSTRTCR